MIRSSFEFQQSWILHGRKFHMISTSCTETNQEESSRRRAKQEEGRPRGGKLSSTTKEQKHTARSLSFWDMWERMWCNIRGCLK